MPDPVALLRHEGGAIAIEFALLAPIFFFGLIAMVDIAFAAYQRMTMDHVLRAGAQSAMADPGVSNVIKVLNSTAAENFAIGVETPTATKPRLNVSAERYCICPESPGIKVDCSKICTGLKPTRAYYLLSASQTYPPMILPDMNLRPQIKVQVR